MEQNKTTNARQWSGRWKLLAVVLVCAAPMLLSYLTYYVIKPSGRTNYGTQIWWGFYYIAGRYGSPCGAWAHSEAHNWY